jgi:hypothetical protein
MSLSIDRDTNCDDYDCHQDVPSYVHTIIRIMVVSRDIYIYSDMLFLLDNVIHIGKTQLLKHSCRLSRMYLDLEQKRKHNHHDQTTTSNHENLIDDLCVSFLRFAWNIVG